VDKKTKSIFIIISAVCVVSVMFSLQLFIANRYESEKRMALERDLDESKVMSKVLEKKHEQLKEEKGQLQIEFQSLQAKYDEADKRRQDDLKRAQEDMAELKARISEKDNSLAELKKEIEVQHKKAEEIKSRLEGELKAVKTEYEDASYQLNQVKMAKEILEERIKEIISRKEVELGRIIVKPAGEDERKVLEGQVLIINPDFRFAIVNLGKKDGMKLGDMLEVRREDKYIGKIKVERLYDTMVGATILPELIEEDIVVGDKAKLL